MPGTSIWPTTDSGQDVAGEHAKLNQKASDIEKKRGKGPLNKVKALF